MRIYGRNLSKEVVVELPCGSTWKMGLKNGVGATNGIVWLDDGWREFANHYSLKRGHLLVFRYEGNSKFHVVICDITTCEIDYSSNPVQRNEPNNTTREKQHFMKRKQTEEDNFQSNKKTRTGPCGETQSDSLSPRSKGSQCNKSKGKQVAPDKGDGEKSIIARKSKLDVLRGMERLTTSEKAKALTVASGFESKTPHFQIVMQPSYVLSSRLKIPTQFARQYLKAKACAVELKIGERNWRVNYSSGASTTRSWLTPRFNNGWRNFSEDNKLDIGDVCVFVLAEGGTEVSFDVTIFRANFLLTPGCEAATSSAKMKPECGS
ncbi:hypothetical protein TIFTF001_000682 [Ficus carica]|uniref:TF-B3 domain-containing protein n=1 Tax=Ficus carica TaxID=3494 RepID=A0AA87ZHM2_FICCA|nr:hypothetical protein TIFTF001_000682 [Ficus carica]